MKPFDEVTFDIKQGDITYTYGGTVVSIYDDEESEEMCMVSILGGQVLHVKQSDCTSI